MFETITASLGDARHSDADLRYISFATDQAKVAATMLRAVADGVDSELLDPVAAALEVHRTVATYVTGLNSLPDHVEKICSTDIDDLLTTARSVLARIDTRIEGRWVGTPVGSVVLGVDLRCTTREVAALVLGPDSPASIAQSRWLGVLCVPADVAVDVVADDPNVLALGVVTRSPGDPRPFHERVAELLDEGCDLTTVTAVAARASSVTAARIRSRDPIL